MYRGQSLRPCGSRPHGRAFDASSVGDWAFGGGNPSRSARGFVPVRHSAVVPLPTGGNHCSDSAQRVRSRSMPAATTTLAGWRLRRPGQQRQAHGQLPAQARLAAVNRGTWPAYTLPGHGGTCTQAGLPGLLVAEGMDRAIGRHPTTTGSTSGPPSPTWRGCRGCPRRGRSRVPASLPATRRRQPDR